MAKKRQQDFAKTQLKPGRMLTRRKNVNLPLKTKKITMPKMSDGSPKSISSILDFLAKKSGTSAAKITSLKHIEQLIDSEQVNFVIAEIFEVLTKLITESDPTVRNTAIKLMKKIFEKKNSETLRMKIFSFRRLFINTLDSGMSNTYAKVKGSILIVINIILEHYPELICSSMQILKSFQNMIGLQLRKLSHQQSSKSGNVPILQDGHINNENYRIQVLDTLKLFLKEMLRNLQPDTVVEEDYDEQEVYWNCEGPLHLEIYAGGGLKPIDIEKAVVNHLDSQEDPQFKDPSVIDDYIMPIIKLIRQTFLEEVPINSKADDNHVQNKTIQNLSILFQVLCEITELTQSVPCDELDKELKSFLLDDVFKRNLFPFHPSGFFDSNQRPEAAELNLAVCFLHSKFILQLECAKEYNTIVMSYISKVFQMSYEIRNNSVPMLVKILKTYFSITHQDQTFLKLCSTEHLVLHRTIPGAPQKVSDFIIDTLGHMSSLLRNSVGRPTKYSNKLTNKDVLVSLFMKLSLHPAYDFLINTVAMKNWFNWLLVRLIDIPNSGIVNKNLLRITKIIANRKHECFLKALGGIDDSKFRALLKYDDPDVRDTAIFVIYNMQNVSGSLLEDISNVILLDTTFPVQYAVRFIRLLTCKFTEKHQSTETNIDISAFRKGRINFIQFLLNIAIDSLNVTSEKWLDYDANEYMKAMEPFKDVAAYNVLPSLHWKEHSKLFEVCQKSLSLLPQKLVNSIAVLMFKEVLIDTRNLPIHSTIAILKLNNWEIKDRHYRFQLNDLIFSSLLTTSVLTHMSVEDEWYKYNVVELMDSMELSRQTALDTLQRQLQLMEKLNGIAVYHILRICKFYLDRRLFKPEDGERVLNILEGYKEKCSDKSFKQQPLFVQLYNIFYFYA